MCVPGVHLGPYPKMSLVKARAERDRWNAVIGQGKDPRAVKRAKKLQQETGSPPTMRQRQLLLCPACCRWTA
jgi:hypothetical protein